MPVTGRVWLVPLAFLLSGSAIVSRALGDEGSPPKPKSPLDFKVKDIEGKEVDLSRYRGQVLLVVNTASKCGLTPQYEALEALHRKYKDRGFAVLAFPANEFGAQEPGTDPEIREFCKSKYDVTFPLHSKIVVKGDGIHPLYAFLTGKDTNPGFAGPIAWNFTKFLVSRKGEVIARFEPREAPSGEALVAALEKALAADRP